MSEGFECFTHKHWRVRRKGMKYKKTKPDKDLTVEELVKRLTDAFHTIETNLCYNTSSYKERKYRQAYQEIKRRLLQTRHWCGQCGKELNHVEIAWVQGMCCSSDREENKEQIQEQKPVSMPKASTVVDREFVEKWGTIIWQTKPFAFTPQAYGEQLERMLAELGIGVKNESKKK